MVMFLLGIIAIIAFFMCVFVLGAWATASLSGFVGIALVFLFFWGVWKWTGRNGTQSRRATNWPSGYGSHADHVHVSIDPTRPTMTESHAVAKRRSAYMPGHGSNQPPNPPIEKPGRHTKRATSMEPDMETLWTDEDDLP